MQPLIALNFAYVAIVISLSQKNLNWYEMCEAMSESSCCISIGCECIEPGGDCLDILDVGEFFFTYTMLSFFGI